MVRENLVPSLVILGLFTLAILATEVFQASIPNDVLRFSFPYLCWMFAVLAGFHLLKRPQRMRFSIGLSNQPGLGILVGFLFSLPMAVGFLILFDTVIPSLTTILTSSVLPGFFEEVFYRGFLVGGLIAVAGWRFIPAALIGALIFGIGHWFQGATLTQAITAALFTAIGGLWFAWLFFRWNHNLWVVITLHVLMNAYWEIWQIDTTAIGGNAANMCRLATIVVSLAGTEWAVRKRVEK